MVADLRDHDLRVGVGKAAVALAQRVIPTKEGSREPCTIESKGTPDESRDPSVPVLFSPAAIFHPYRRRRLSSRTQ